MTQIAVAIDERWRAWIAENVSRGCSDESILFGMTSQGIAPDDARRALDAARTGVHVGAVLRQLTPGYFMADGRRVAVPFALASPVIGLFDDLLDADECGQIIDLARPRLSRSMVVDRMTGATVVNTVRTSDGAHTTVGESPAINALERRIADLTGIPIDHGEPVQILRYLPGALYAPHQDYFPPSDPGSAMHIATGGNRVATVVVYLNTVPAGGQTRFPTVGLSIAARQGSGACFGYSTPSGALDDRCLHAGDPALEGEKWVATKWLRARPYRR